MATPDTNRNKMNDYIEINREAWNKKTDIHILSDFYDNAAFLKGKNTLKEIELNLLGDVRNKTILHLQCHFGQDTISLARMGAKVTGVDLSDCAIDKANEFAKQTNTFVTFICCDIYDLPEYLDQEFDIVFTSYGVISWLPDLNKWAEIISRFLKPGGQFIFVEFHPVVWMFDNEFRKIGYSYFNSGVNMETEASTYADTNTLLEHKTANWNHSISDVLNNLIQCGIEIKTFDEFDYAPYNCFSNTVKIDADKYRISHLDNKIPITFAVEGVKKEP